MSEAESTNMIQLHLFIYSIITIHVATERARLYNH